MPFPKIPRKAFPHPAGEMHPLGMIEAHVHWAEDCLQALRSGDPKGLWPEGPPGRLKALQALIHNVYEIEQIAKRLREEAIDLSIT